MNSIDIVLSGPDTSDMIVLSDGVPLGSVVSLYFDADHILAPNSGPIDDEWREFLTAYEGPVTIDRQPPGDESTRVTVDEWSVRFGEPAVCDNCGAKAARGMIDGRPICGHCMYQHMDMATPRERVARRLAAATDGAWRAKGRYVIAPDSTVLLEADDPADAKLAAHAKQDLRGLLDRVDEMERALKEDIYNLALDAEIHDIVGIVKELTQ